MDVTLLDPHGGDLGGFFMVHGSHEQCGALTMDQEFRRAVIDASLIVDNFGVVPAATGEGVSAEMGCTSRRSGRSESAATPSPPPRTTAADRSRSGRSGAQKPSGEDHPERPPGPTARPRF
jgi:hypothetical protein